MYNKWPTKEEPSFFKIASCWFGVDASLTTIERQTYSLLEWVGDVGGLFDGLKIVGTILVAPFAAFAVQTEVLTSALKVHLFEDDSSNETEKV